MEWFYLNNSLAESNKVRADSDGPTRHQADRDDGLVRPRRFPGNRRWTAQIFHTDSVFLAVNVEDAVVRAEGVILDELRAYRVAGAELFAVLRRQVQILESLPKKIKRLMTFYQYSTFNGLK